jgi:hypothetical protein
VNNVNLITLESYQMTSDIVFPAIKITANKTKLEPGMVNAIGKDAPYKEKKTMSQEHS